MIRYNIKVRKENCLFTAYVNGQYHSEKLVQPENTREMTKKILMKKYTEEMTDFVLQVCKTFKAKEINV